MIRLMLCVTTLMFISGCNDSTAEQKEFIDQVKASSTPKIEPIPEMQNYEPFKYSASELRSPFVAPQPEVIENKLVQIKNCLHPDPDRDRYPLEKFPLDNLRMKGIIAKSDGRWALIEAATQGLYRVKRGEYMGLYHGKVLSVQADHLELLELIPDGTGCWKERLTKLEMLEAEQGGTSEY
ncbi:MULTISPECIES: pilus assembly protein PilP [Pseudoalteromonas]|uniref:pilus assembly protein PilP n=1 Tax=Pseudoalteromonas TaxID=53246 RepID=UPI001109A81E|nr:MULTISPECIES: pilus assembly protein PilP [Pseudoalteromonas]MCG9759571.1 pilus assembly protein PilP [Pseudoalteromonas sp. Isolate6]NKC17264.1 pilus assembly protein PilP [Pseudoalteromonas galatheae]